MSWWQFALILLAVLWGLQILGTWVQMSHYQKVMAGVTASSRNGYLGTGSARGALGKGVIIILVASADERVSKLLLMEGRSVFAKFREIEQFNNVPLEKLKSGLAFGPEHKGRNKALSQAIEQIEKAKGKQAEMAQADGAGMPAQEG